MSSRLSDGHNGGFDHHDPGYTADRFAAAEKLHECPVTWSEKHGGFWVLSKYSDVNAAGRDPDVFASGNDFGDGPKQGNIIPYVKTGAGGIVTADPPRHATLRKLMNPWFSPTAVNKLRAQLEEDVTYFIDQFIESGKAELVHDLIGPFPGLVTLRLLGVPIEYYERMADIMHRTVYVPADDPERADVDSGVGWIVGLFLGWIEERRANPTEDYLSFLANMVVDGEQLTSDEAMFEAVLLLGAGIDTTTALMGHSLRYLSRHPDAKEWLAADQARLGPACDEFLRVYSPITATARTVMRDVQVREEQLQAGDRVLLLWHAANNDPEQFECPEQVRLDRLKNRHIAFASGPHRCIGARYAKAEWEMVISQVLKRLPDFEVIESEAIPTPDYGIVAGWISLPVRFTPGTRVGTGALNSDGAGLVMRAGEGEDWSGED